MKTVYDFGITKEECEYMGISEQSHYLSVVDADSANLGIAFLLYYRGEKGKAEVYAKKLPPSLYLDFLRTVTHPFISRS